MHASRCRGHDKDTSQNQKTQVNTLPLGISHLAELGCQVTVARASGPSITSGAWAWLGWEDEVLYCGAKNMA